MSKRYRFVKGKDNLESIETKLKSLNRRIDFEKPYTGKKDILSIIKYMWVDHFGYNLKPTYTINIETGRKYKQSLGSTRSIEDMYLLCKTYIPDVRLKDVVNTVHKKSNDIRYIRYCGTHNRHMYRIMSYGRKDIPQEFSK